MTKSTISVNGGAMSNVNRTVIMTRAWAIFRQTYCYPRIKFSSIGRPASTLACAKHADKGKAANHRVNAGRACMRH